MQFTETGVLEIDRSGGFVEFFPRGAVSMSLQARLVVGSTFGGAGISVMGSTGECGSPYFEINPLRRLSDEGILTNIRVQGLYKVKVMANPNTSTTGTRVQVYACFDNPYIP